MSYQTVKDGIAGILKALTYQEGNDIDNFSDASSQEMGNVFIIKCVSGEMKEEVSETLADRFYDSQTWEILIAFPKSSQNDIINQDEA